MAKKLRVLILEDVSTDAQLVEQELRRRNVAFTSQVVATREAFTAALKGFAPDVILADYMLPQFNGMKALSLAKELSPDEPFIIVTGSINEQTAVECIKAGAADYVTKGHLGRLVPAVQGALEKKREREERKRAERALGRSEERFRKLFEESNDAIFIHTLDGWILDVNSRACQMVGYSPEQLRGMRIHSLHAEEAEEASSTALEETTQSRSTRFESAFKRADGTLIDVEVSARLVDQREGLVQAIVRDITERKRAEEALQESQERLSKAQRIARLGFWDWNITANELYWSDEIYRIFGLDPQEFGATYEEFVDCVHSDDRELVQEHLDAALQDGAEYGVDHRIVLPGGEVRHVHEQGEVDRDADGAPVRLVGTVIDITERKTLEEQLWQSQKLEAIGRLAGGVAHDLNNLLVVIDGYAQMILDALDPDSSLCKDAEHVIGASKRAADLTRQLLAFARRQPLAPSVLNINDLVENTLKMLRRIIGEDIQLKFIPDPDLGNVQADQGQIEQVLMNLAVNARDAMPKGGKLTIKTANAVRDEEYVRAYVSAQPGPHVMLSVSDTGSGMDQEVQRRIFEPFFTTKEVGKGTGLGLATVYGIVKQHGGNIWVYSEPGSGTTFKVYLPRVDAEAKSLPTRKPTQKRPGGTETILLVEDEQSVRDLAKRVLEQQGYQVLAAASAEQAEEVFAQHVDDIALVVTDVVMPDCGGVELCERLAERCRSLKVLYVSGYSETAFIPADLLGAGRGFLQKPFRAEDLAREVREVLDAPGYLQGAGEAVPHGAKRS